MTNQNIPEAGSESSARLGAEVARLRIRLAQFEQGDGAGESEWATLRNRLNIANDERNCFREALRKAREIARDDGQEIDVNGALAEVFNICDMALDPHQYVD